jgi:hypothetical protein
VGYRPVTAVLCMIAAAQAFAQTSPSAEQSAAPPSAVGQRKSTGEGESRVYSSARRGSQTQKVESNIAASQRQSGLNQAQATSLMRQQGYARIGELRAEPNSIWVWQADAMKNGRRVRLGIDYRGNLLEISSGQAQPCTTPGVGFGAGAMGVGSRLSEATRCSGR